MVCYKRVISEMDCPRQYLHILESQSGHPQNGSRDDANDAEMWSGVYGCEGRLDNVMFAAKEEGMCYGF